MISKFKLSSKFSLIYQNLSGIEPRYNLDVNVETNIAVGRIVVANCRQQITIFFSFVLHENNFNEKL